MSNIRVSVMRIFLCILSLFCLSFAQTRRSKEHPVKIRKVALFKNGMGYFISESRLPKSTKSIEFGQLPVPVLGTFWIDYPEKLHIKNIVTSMHTKTDTFPIRNVTDLLKANIGNKVTLYTSLEDNTTFTGVIEAFTQDDPADHANPYMMGGKTIPHENIDSDVLLLKTGKGIVALQKGIIVSAVFDNKKVSATLTKKIKSPALRLELEKPSNGETVTLSFLAGGITWSPSYRIDLSSPKQAVFTAKAVVINELTDLEDVAIDLVTGFPNIRYSNMISPVSMKEKLSEYLDALSGRNRSSVRYRSSSIMSQSVSGYLNNQMPAYIPGQAEHSEVDPATGTVSEDLFLYPLKNMNIKRNETACIPLFSKKVPYEHIYIWNIKDYLANDDRYRMNRNTEADRDTIWHVARLTNTLKVPWTTAPCEFIKNGQITGQDVCYYTPAGAKATVHINHAINISSEQTEYEVKRNRRAKTIHGRNYDLVTIEGILNLNSRLDKTVKIEINKLLKGKVLTTAPEAADYKIAKGLKRINTNHKLVWSLEVKPGEEKKLTYKYEVYVRD